MKRIYLLIAIASMILSGCVTSKQMIYLSKDINQSTETGNINLEEIFEKHRDYPAYYLNYERSYEYSGSHSLVSEYSHWYRTDICRKKYVIIDPDVDYFTSVSESMIFSDDTLLVKLTYPDETTEVFTKDDCFQAKSSLWATNYKLAFPRVVRGTIVEIYTKSRHAISYPDLQQDYGLYVSVPCKSLTFRFVIPDWWNIKVKKLGDNKYLKYKTEHSYDYKKDVYVYHKENIDSIEDEMFSPDISKLTESFNIMFTRFSCGKYNYYDSNHWKDFTSSIRSECINNDSWFSRRMKKTTDSLITESMTAKEKIEAINDFIHENIEVNAYEDGKNFAKILKTRKGNMFHVTGLMYAMLKEAGFKPQFLLVNSSDSGYLDYNFPSIRLVPYPAVDVHVGQTTYVLFPWLKYLAVDEIPENFRNQVALVVPEYRQSSTYSDATSGNKTNTILKLEKSIDGAKFVRLPEGRVDKDFSVENFNIILEEDGSMLVEERMIYKGSLAYSLRNLIENTDPEDLDDNLKSMLTYSDGLIDIKSMEILDKDDYKKPLVMKFKYKVNNLVSVFDDDILFQTSGLFSSTSLTKYKIDSEKRKNPIEIGFDVGFRKNITITYPKSWQLETKFKDMNYSNKFGEVTAIFKMYENKIEIYQDVLLKKSSEPKEEFGELLNVMGKRSRLNIPTIIFRNNS